MKYYAFVNNETIKYDQLWAVMSLLWCKNPTHSQKSGLEAD